MSNFSTFFPAASGDGEGGLPVNSYLGLSVSLVSGDTNGYNATTGLYTHPNGSFWLRTGFEIIDDGTTYPDATSISSLTYSGFTINTQSQGTEEFQVQYDGTNFYVLNVDNIYQYTSAGVYTGFNFSVSGQEGDSNCMSWDGTNFYIAGTSNDSVFQYTSAGVYTGFTFSINSQAPVVKGLTYDGTNFYVVGTSNQRVAQYTSAGVYTGYRFSVAGETANPVSLDYDGTNFYVGDSSNGNINSYTSAGVFVETIGRKDQALNLTSAIYYTPTSKYYTTETGNSKNGVYEYDPSRTIGDTTARTDSDSLAPLFSRIK